MYDIVLKLLVWTPLCEYVPNIKTFTSLGGSREGSHSSRHSSHYKCFVGSVGKFAAETIVEALGGYGTRATGVYSWLQIYVSAQHVPLCLCLVSYASLCILLCNEFSEKLSQPKWVSPRSLWGLQIKCDIYCKFPLICMQCYSYIPVFMFSCELPNCY